MFTMVSSVFFSTSVSDACFKCFIYFKTISSVASLSSPFFCLALVSGAERWRRCPLVWIGPTCLRAGTASETWAGRHGKREGEQRRSCPNGGLAAVRARASHTLSSSSCSCRSVLNSHAGVQTRRSTRRFGQHPPHTGNCCCLRSAPATSPTSLQIALGGSSVPWLVLPRA
jgi:hypothetical protein